MNINIYYMIRRLAVTTGLLTAAIGTAAAQNQDTGHVLDQTPGGNNYISTKTFTNQSGTEYVTDVEYYDGLGYLVQKQSSHASPSGGVLVQPVVYDNMRRADATSYLPYSSNQQDMIFRQDAVSEQGAWYASRFGGDRYAFSNTVYESGPQGRPVSTMKPGSVYRNGNHSATVDYSLNEEADSVRRIGFDPLGFCVLPDGYYPEHSVRRVTSTDEDGRSSMVFSDAFGRTLLTRQYEGFGGSGRRCDTYYVYDVRDSLVCVIQPEGEPHIEESMALSSDEVSLDVEFLDRYCFTWKYDAWGNVIESHVPGGGTSYFVYDDRDRCISCADEAMWSNGIWKFITYDNQDRVVEERFGRWNSSGSDLQNSHTALQQSYWSSTGSNIPSDLSTNLAFLPDEVAVAGALRTDRCLGMVSYMRVYEAPSANNHQLTGGNSYVDRAFYYDAKGRLIQTVEVGSDGWRSRYSTLYDFVGNIVATLENHTPPQGSEDVLLTRYTYDERGRMLGCVVTLNDQRQHEVAYSYDELGRPNGKEFRTFEGEDDTPVTLASESLTRNLQGWRTGTSVAYDGMPVFGELLCHYDPMMGVPQYSGMISEISYGHGDMMDMQSYSYDYDGLGRFTYSDHYLNGSLAEENFETGFRYDRNGNILSFERYGNRMNYYTGTNLEDSPDFHYDGNRLVRARRLPFIDEDGNFEENPDCLYSYDSNGRMISDGRQGLDISYNVLNFTKEITNNEGMTATYTYLSDGSKRSVSTHDGLGKLYRGSFVYDGGSDVGSSVSLESVATPEGRLAVTDDGILDLWYAKDYLGNVRSVIDLASGVIEENDYLPFGTRIQDDNQPVMSDNRWRYANKEEQSSLVGGSCTLIDFGARNYDPWSARWTTADPMAQKYYSMSPYNYCAGNPVMFVDPDGMIWRDTVAANELKDAVNRRVDKLWKTASRLLIREKLSKYGQRRLINNLKQIDNLLTSLQDIDRLGKDPDHVYSFKTPSNDDGRHLVTSEDGRNIQIETSSDALSLHEIAHVRQSLDSGGLVFVRGCLQNAGVKNPGSYRQRLKAISENEVEAYQIQYSMDGSFPGAKSCYGVDGINVHSVANISIPGSLPMEYAYPLIKQYSNILNAEK